MDATSQAPIRFHATQPSYRVDLPPPHSSRPSVLAFSHNKAGSSMFYKILRELCDAVELTFVTIPGILFQGGTEVRSVQVEVELNETGYCYGGFRHFPNFDIAMLDRARATLLVRDPRDALVSLYYSIRDSHPFPKSDGELKRQMTASRATAKALSIDEWAIANHGAVSRSLEGYVAQRFASRPNVVIYRYEDIIFRKRDWIKDIATWYGWEIDDGTIDRIAAEADVFPKAADPTKHIRQVYPGNYTSKLKRVTQEVLTRQFEPYLTLFGYETSLPVPKSLTFWRHWRAR